MNILRRIWFIATGRRQELDLADEMAFHRDMKAQELREQGVSETDIAAATQRQRLDRASAIPGRLGLAERTR